MTNKDVSLDETIPSIKNTHVSVDTDSFSLGIFLLCFFLPFLAPIIALIRGKFLFLWVMLVLYIICFLLLFITVIGWICIVIIDIIIAAKVANGKKNVKVQIQN